MKTEVAVHVVRRADGVWQVEREDGIVPLSVHDNRDEALDRALELAVSEHRPLAMHSHPRRAARWVDRAAWSLLDHAGHPSPWRKAG